MNVERMLKLRLNGYTYARIAMRANVSRQRVQQILAPPRPIRDFVVNKHDGKCAKCGLYVGKSGHVHHAGNETETYNDIENLELLCLTCHRGAHRDLVNGDLNVSPASFIEEGRQKRQVRRHAHLERRNENIKRYRERGMTLRALGKMFKLSHTQIANIINGK